MIMILSFPYHLWGKIEQAAGTMKHKLKQEESIEFV